MKYKQISLITIMLILITACGQKNEEMEKAIKSKDITKIKKLAGSPVDKNYKDKDGKTLIDLAKATKDSTIKKIIFCTVNKDFADKLIGKWKLKGFDKHGRAEAWVSFTYDDDKKQLIEKFEYKMFKKEKRKLIRFSDVLKLLSKPRSVYVYENETFTFFKLFGLNYTRVFKNDSELLYEFDEYKDFKRGRKGHRSKMVKI